MQIAFSSSPPQFENHLAGTMTSCGNSTIRNIIANSAHMNGSMPRVTSSILMRPTPATVLSTVPTGGVIRPMALLMTNSTPKYTGSMPAALINGSIIAQMDSRGAFIIAANDLRGGTGICSRRLSHHQVTQSEAPINRPGTMPARNSLVIDTLAATPKITKPIDGGMIGAMMPPAASKPADRALSRPALTIIGSNSAVSAAASATAEPDRDASRHAAMIAT